MPSEDVDQNFDLGQKTELRPIRRILLLTLLPLVSVGLWISLRSSPIINGFHDFTCFVNDFTIDDGYTTGDWMQQQAELIYAEIYISVFEAHWGGGGCHHESLANHTAAHIDNYTLFIEDDGVRINEAEIIFPGQSWQESRFYFEPTPWWIYRYRIDVKNQGYLEGTRRIDGTITNFPNKILVVTGYAGSGFFPNPITVVVFFTGIGIFMYDVVLGIRYLARLTRRLLQSN